ncbi:N-acetyltransferase [Lysobacter helvus]|uniref:N-acetyltransferase n=2 Tax=Lysobacteraceae TaxID=32033 RepID=A0ABN6FWK3_9GAMM|nr:MULTISPECIES: arsinothricin resistance N-acetyltransferase ArsN1 family B [Lysobacter]BCT93315.1 N-acetyltransferase [Lysobacter caseinilyticus]BCT96468.1 N-acetyltransferase [Lysobacter helvus]
MRSLATLRDATRTDAPALATIYNHYIASTCVTFETAPVSADDMAARIADTQALPLPWLVAEGEGGVVGYAYATRWRARHAYRFAAESTVYLAPEQMGRGLGTALYTALVHRLRAHSLHTVIGGIALPNAASIALHERLGFRKVAHFEQVGFKHDRWIDVGYWQLQLEPAPAPA